MQWKGGTHLESETRRAPHGRQDGILRQCKPREGLYGQQAGAVYRAPDFLMLLEHGHTAGCPGQTIGRIEAGRPAPYHQDIVRRRRYLRSRKRVSLMIPSRCGSALSAFPLRGSLFSPQETKRECGERRSRQRNTWFSIANRATHPGKPAWTG